ncbi:hypothetical protein SAMN05518848_11297 [Paenibacillus sp. PDC88]|nr:hypothetical protein SAMN05518848_11297 [Paenibacillus sp. PDC88]SFS88855.1 hypothetical protein SAMN04488601_10693 [Paenibacillus sp. 453mf]
MLMNTRIPSRFVGMTPGEFVVVGLSFRPMREEGFRSDFGGILDFHFKIGDVEKPLDIVSALIITEQKVIN